MSESVYILPCPCGQQVRSHEPLAICSKCGTVLEVRNWGQPPSVEEQKAALAFFESESKNGKAKES